MKRISIWIVFLALTPSITQARWYRSSHYRIRYSPYAFQYGTTGLIPGAIKYSPYAFNRSSSGLVFEGTRYTPYAFTYDNPGLVVDYSVWPIARSQPVVVCVNNHITASAPRTHRVRSRPARTARPARAGARAVAARRAQEDRMTILREQLRQRGAEDAGINRILRIDGQLISADFKLRNRDLIVKYWNVDEIDALADKVAVKQKFFDRYKEDWEAYAQTHKAKGGSIYYVEATDEESIVAALDACAELNPGGSTTDETTMYAKK